MAAACEVPLQCVRHMVLMVFKQSRSRNRIECVVKISKARGGGADQVALRDALGAERRGPPCRPWGAGPEATSRRRPCTARGVSSFLSSVDFSLALNQRPCCLQVQH